MKNLFKITLLLVILVCSLTSCKEPIIDPISDNPAPSPTTTNVHMIYRDYVGGKWRAYHWLNGTATLLDLSASTRTSSYARKIYINGSDVYVIGYEDNGTKNIAKYWKNGVSVDVTNGTNHAYAQDMLVVGNDVYVVGYEQISNIYVARLWKNGVGTTLPSPANISSSSAVGIGIVNGVLYIGGTQSVSPVDTGVYWTVNTTTNAITSNTLGQRTVEGVIVNGNFVYVYGTVDTTRPGYYRINTTNNTFITEAFQGNGRVIDMTIVGNDIHCAGYTLFNNSTTANRWVNGTMSPILGLANKSEYFAVAVHPNGDVYAGGYEINANNKRVAKYWINSNITSLTNGAYSSDVTDIVIR